jgi:hypothetical protein
MERLKQKKELNSNNDEMFAQIEYMIDTQISNRINNHQQPTDNTGYLPSQGTPTLSQETIEFLDGAPDVPDDVKDICWALASPQNQLSQVNSQFEQRRLEAGARMSLQAVEWSKHLPPEQVAQLELYVRLLQLKSRGGIERRLLAPQISEQTHRETVMEETARQKGIIDKLLGR